MTLTSNSNFNSDLGQSHLKKFLNGGLQINGSKSCVSLMSKPSLSKGLTSNTLTSSREVSIRRSLRKCSRTCQSMVSPVRGVSMTNEVEQAYDQVNVASKDDDISFNDYISWLLKTESISTAYPTPHRARTNSSYLPQTLLI